jgi:3-hydroxyisobutyrate dehydrogenase-like beta-hydroxyacid dehydrogenase
MDIGFIGIGSMGAAMVPNLVNAGHRVSVWNRSREAGEALAGVTVLDSPADAFQNDVVITMLSDDKAVRATIIESDALATAHGDCIHVMAATISLALVEELKTLHHDAGIAYVAAPVFGVPAAAAKALLNIVVAGDAAAIAKVQPLFDVLGQKTWPLGDDPARANVAKIAGNMMITLAIEAMGEATALTESYGLKAADFLGIITNTLFASPSYQRYGGFIATDTYEPGFKLTLGLKDVNLALDAADAKHATLPALQIVRENMLQAIDQGLGAKDWSILAKIARRRAGLDEGVA